VFPLYAFDGYSAEIDGQPLEIGASEKNHIQIHFEEGMQGHLEIRFVGKDYWRIGDYVSLAALVLLVVSIWKPKKRSRA